MAMTPEQAAEAICSAANIVTNHGYYELDIDATVEAIRQIQREAFEAGQVDMRERATHVKWEEPCGADNWIIELPIQARNAIRAIPTGEE